MRAKTAVLFFLVLILLFTPGAALELRNGGQVTIDTPINDDVIATGGMVTVNAPVESLIVAGGQIIINAPVTGDVIAAGGSVMVNAPVGGKVVAAGGEIQLNADAKNAVLAGGTIAIGRNATVSRDVLASGNTMVNDGTVKGTLTVNAENFVNNGNAGKVVYTRPDNNRVFGVSFFDIALTIGFLVLGLVLIALFPGPYSAAEAEVRRSPVKDFFIGWGTIVGSAIILVIIAVTMIGIPVALMGLLPFIGLLMAASLIASSALGSVVLGSLKMHANPYLLFTAGFILFTILTLIPVLGIIVRIIAVGVGSGAIVVVFLTRFQGLRGTWGSAV